MGNQICFHPRLLLTDDASLNFKSSNLIRDVLPIIDDWRRDGCDLALTVKDFERTFNVVVDTEKQFASFDTDNNGRIDAHEVLMVYILLCNGDIERKIETVFSVFDFPGRNTAGTINFEEAVMLVNACVTGLTKVCPLDFKIESDELTFFVKSMFDMHRLGLDERLSKKQYKAWVLGDSSPRSFVDLFDKSQALPDIYAQVQKRNVEQAIVFQMLACGHLHVNPVSLVSSADFHRVSGIGVTEEELRNLVDLMCKDSDHPGGWVPSERYHQVLRPWNIFCMCDLDGSGTLDTKEMEILLWIQLRERPSRILVRQFVTRMDTSGDGEVSRTEWVEAIMEGERITRPKSCGSDADGSDSEAAYEARRAPRAGGS
jgi:Ca2+-binding EF-hand superfamily protein